VRASCRSPPAEIIKSLGQHLPRSLWLLGGQHAVTMVFELFGWCLYHDGGRIERPPEMLSGVTAADRQPVMIQHLVVQRIDQIELLGK
jgi:hypothetical protein